MSLYTVYPRADLEEYWCMPIVVVLKKAMLLYFLYKVIYWVKQDHIIYKHDSILGRTNYDVTLSNTSGFDIALFCFCFFSSPNY